MKIDTEIDIIEDVEKVRENRLRNEYSSGKRLHPFNLIFDFIIKYLGIGVSAAVLVLISELFGLLGLVFLVGLSTVLSLHGYISGGGLIRRMGSAVRIDERTSAENASSVYECFVEACKESGVDPSNYRFYIGRLGSPTAFIHHSLGKDAIVVSTELIENVTKKEMKSIIQHEIGHSFISNYKIFFFLILGISTSVIATIFYFIGMRGLNLFSVVFLVGIFVNVLISFSMGREEKKADRAVNDNLSFYLSRSLVKIKEESYHVRNRFFYILHQLIDPHPPINMRSNVDFDIDVSYSIKNLRNTLSKICRLGLGITLILAALSLNIDVIGTNILFVSYVFLVLAMFFHDEMGLKEVSGLIKWIIGFAIVTILLYLIGSLGNYIIGISFGFFSSVGLGFVYSIVILWMVFLLIPLFINTNSLENIPSMKTYPFSDNSEDS